MNLKEHGKTIFVDKLTGEIICNCGCGRVLTEKIPDLEHLETNHDVATAKEFKHRHTSQMNIRLHDMGHATFIDQSGKDFRGQPLSHGAADLMYKLNWHTRKSRCIDQGDRRLWGMLQSLNEVAAINKIAPKLADDAAYLIHKAHRLGLPKNMKTRALAIACIYFAGKQSGITVNFREMRLSIVETGKVISSKIVAKYIEQLKEQLDVNINTHSDEARLIMKACGEFGFEKDVRTLAIKFLSVWCQYPESCGKTSGVRAGVALFWTLDLLHANHSLKKINKKWDKEQVAELFQVTRAAIVMTLKANADWIVDHKQEILN